MTPGERMRTRRPAGWLVDGVFQTTPPKSTDKDVCALYASFSVLAMLNEQKRDMERDQ